MRQLLRFRWARGVSVDAQRLVVQSTELGKVRQNYGVWLE